MSFCELAGEQLGANLARLEGDEQINSLSAWGDTSLLAAPIISIVGAREMSLYTKNLTAQLASALSAAGAVIASGGALGVDICALNAAAPGCIAVLPSGLGALYPASNAQSLERIAQSGGLLLSEYGAHHQPRRHDYLRRNRIVVALAQALVITQAAPRSGSLNSATWARKLGVPIYVLAQRAGESDGSMQLAASGAAGLIYDVGEFTAMMSEKLALNASERAEPDELLAFIGAGCSLDEALARFGERVYDYELDGRVVIDGALVRAR